MKSLTLHIYIVILFVSGTATNSFCQTKPIKDSKPTKDSSLIHKSGKIFDKQPKFKPLIDDVIKPIGYVNDYDNLFSADEVYQMDSLLYDFETKESIQIVVVTFDTTQIGPNEVDIATKSIEKGWKVGGDSSKGIVVGISKPYRKMRIQNGLEVQKFLSDEETKKILDNGFIPEFKNNEYFKGTWTGLKLLMNALKQSGQKSLK